MWLMLFIASISPEPIAEQTRVYLCTKLGDLLAEHIPPDR